MLYYAMYGKSISKVLYRRMMIYYLSIILLYILMINA